jgi:hypothetical protein
VKKLKYRIHEVISTEWLTSLSTIIKLKYCVIKRISHYSIDAPVQLLKVSVAYWARKLTKTVVLNSFPHGRFWQFVYKENVRCTRLMQHSLQVVISTEWLTSLSTSIQLQYCVIKRISHYSIDAPGHRLKVSVAYWTPTVMLVPQ